MQHKLFCTVAQTIPDVSLFAVWLVCLFYLTIALILRLLPPANISRIKFSSPSPTCLQPSCFAPFLQSGSSSPIPPLPRLHNPLRMYAAASVRYGSEPKCSLVACDTCFSDLKLQFSWMFNATEFRLCISILSGPVSLLVALWGMTSSKSKVSRVRHGVVVLACCCARGHVVVERVV